MMWMRRIVRAVALASATLTAGAIVAQAQGGPAATGVGVKVVTRPYDIAAMTRPHGLPDTVYRGRAIFMQRCAYCHDGVGQPSYKTFGPWLDPEVTAGLGDAGVRMFVTQGTDNMPGFQYALTPAQIDDVIAYVKTIPASSKPTEDQLAGRLPGAAAAGSAQNQGGD